jgi:uncharacterized protein (DUF433 family)
VVQSAERELLVLIGQRITVTMILQTVECGVEECWERELLRLIGQRITVVRILKTVECGVAEC